MKITDSVTIDRPIDEVFAYAGDPSNDPQWSNTIVEARPSSDGPLIKGSTLTQQIRFAGKRIEVDCEISEYEPERRVAFTMVAGSNTGQHLRTFESVDGGTQVTLSTEGDSSGLFKIADPVLNKIGTRQMGADLHTLKAILESA